VHRYIGVAVAVVLTWLAVTGVLLNHPSWTGGPPARHVVAFDPGNPLRLLRGGEILEESTDGGATWSEVTMLVPAEDVVDIVFAPDRAEHVWVATRELGVVRSLDGGIVWEPVDLGFTPLREGAEIERLAAGPGGRLLVSTTAGDLITHDGGSTWLADAERPLRTGGPHRFIHQLHTGYLVGPALVLLHDLAGVGALLLAVTGLVIWWKPFVRRRRRTRRG